MSVPEQSTGKEKPACLTSRILTKPATTQGFEHVIGKDQLMVSKLVITGYEQFGNSSGGNGNGNGNGAGFTYTAPNL